MGLFYFDYRYCDNNIFLSHAYRPNRYPNTRLRENWTAIRFQRHNCISVEDMYGVSSKSCYV
jgi:hypothetical protein